MIRKLPHTLVICCAVFCLKSGAALALPSVPGVCASLFRALIGGAGPHDWPARVSGGLAKDLAAFTAEIPHGAREGLTPRDIEHLFQQNQALYTGHSGGQTVAEGEFLKAFWTPKSEIGGVVEKDGVLRVFTHRGYGPFVRSALPPEFRGKKVEVVETDRRGSVIDPRWVARHRENYYTGEPVVLLTGATSGLGLSVAKKLVARGYRVVLTGRASSLKGLREAGISESDRILIRPMDITRPEERKRVLDEVTGKWGGVDMLINNASVSMRGSVEDSPEANSRRQMDVDFFGPMQLTREVLPLMRMKGRGRIVNVSAVMGFMGFPQMGDYAAAKHALEGGTEALAFEMAPYGVKVSLVEPGLFPTPGIEKTVGPVAGGKPLTDPRSPYLKAQNDLRGVVRWMLRQTDATADSVANVVVKQLEKKNPPVHVQGSFDGWALSLMKRWLPERLFLKILKNQIPNYRNWPQIDLPNSSASPEVGR